MIILKGEGVSPGVAIGHAVKIEGGLPPVYKISLSNAYVEKELERFNEAAEKTINELEAVQEVLNKELGKQHSLMIQSHIMILKDIHFSGAIRKIIKSQKVNAEWAVKVVSEKIESVYEKIDDDYIREKIHDIRDITRRLLSNITGRSHWNHSVKYENIILVSSEMNMSVLGKLNINQIKGFAVDFGGWTSHASIIARSLKIPSVIRLQDVTSKVHTGDKIIVDGNTGNVYINPDESILSGSIEESPKQNGAFCILNGFEKNGISGVRIYINTEFPNELEDYDKIGAIGVGLFRSEFMYIGRNINSISPEEHRKVYSYLAEKVYPHIANIRAFDLGADKLPEIKKLFHETNPALGMRGIRLCLHLEEAFKNQLKGILLANKKGNLRVTFPFISGVDEVRNVKKVLSDVKNEIDDDIPYLPVGVMLEIPSTFFIAGALADEVDFFTLGTNDLIQYTLAKDRNVSDLSSPFSTVHPAIRSGLEMIYNAVSNKKKEVICCGEMSSQPLFLLVLLAIGYRSISINPQAITRVKYVLKHINEKSLAKFYRELSNLNSTNEIENFFLTELKKFFDNDFVNVLIDNFKHSVLQ